MYVSRCQRRRLGVLAATLTAASAVVVAVLAPNLNASAATGCQVTYKVNEWTGGFVGTVDVTAGTSPVHGWTVTWNYGGQQITSSWNAQVTQSGTAVTATNMSYNGELAANATAEFGVQGTWTGSDPAPTNLTVTGSGCSGTSTPTPMSPTPSPTRSPSASPTPSPTLSPSASPTMSPTTRPSTSPTTSPTGAPPGGCGSAVICDGFENQAAGTPSGDWGLNFPNCSGAGTAAIDTTTAHSGSKSLKVTGVANYCNHVFVASTKNLSGIGPVWFARFYVRHTTALPSQHITFVAMHDANDGTNNDLRMGGQNGALQWNRQSDDATLPAQSPVGVSLSVPLPTDTWSCVEFMVNGSAGTMDTWVNGSQVAGLHEDGTPTADIDQQWLSRTNWRPSLTDFRLGWEAYGDGSDTLWYDDVALGSSRIGC